MTNLLRQKVKFAVLLFFVSILNIQSSQAFELPCPQASKIQRGEYPGSYAAEVKVKGGKEILFTGKASNILVDDLTFSGTGQTSDNKLYCQYVDLQKKNLFLMIADPNIAKKCQLNKTDIEGFSFSCK